MSHPAVFRAAPCKTELITDLVWCSRAQLELATVEWVGWFNHDGLHESLGSQNASQRA
jgi:hypothetical protein